jgi:hypothetical protein
MFSVYTKLHCLRPAALSAGQGLAAAMQLQLPSCSVPPSTSSLRYISDKPTRPKGEAPEACPGPRTRSFDQAAAAGETTDTNGSVQVWRQRKAAECAACAVGLLQY